MKILLIGLIALGSLSTFANGLNCQAKYYSGTKTILFVPDNDFTGITSGSYNASSLADCVESESRPFENQSQVTKAIIHYRKDNGKVIKITLKKK
jgi:hypothetical protein